MQRVTKGALGLGGIVAALLAAWTAWGLATSRSAEELPYETVETVGGIELRRYPRTVLVETTAPDERTAFRRLYRYIDGGNESDAEIEMTAPVETTDEVGTDDPGESIPMTAPVRTVERDGDVRMAFYLPEKYDRSSAPLPTEESVRLVVEPPRTLAVYQFSWLATDGRVRRARERLLATLVDRGIDPRGEPSLLRYDDPRTPPWLRTNEVAVEVEERYGDGDR